MYGPPPYNLNPTQLGYMFVGPLVGPLLVTALFLVASDPLALWMARRNNGVFEVSPSATCSAVFEPSNVYPPSSTA